MILILLGISRASASLFVERKNFIYLWTFLHFKKSLIINNNLSINRSTNSKSGDTAVVAEVSYESLWAVIALSFFRIILSSSWTYDAISTVP